MQSNNPNDAINAIGNQKLQQFLTDIQKQFSANLGVANSQIKDAHDEAINKVLNILQQYDTNAAKILKENEMLTTEVAALKKLLEGKNTTSAQVSTPQSR